MDPNATTQLATAVDMGVVRGLITVLTMAVFFGITWWAYHRDNRERFEQDALMVFTDDEIADREASDGAARSERGKGEA